MTPEERKEYMKKYYEANKDKINQRVREHRQVNKDRINERVKKYREENKDKLKAYREENKDKLNQRVKKYREENKDKLKAYREENKDKINENTKKYRQANREKINEQVKKYREENKDKIKQYYEATKDKRNEYIKNRLKSDPIFKFKHNVRNLVRSAIKRKGYKKLTKTESILGCSFIEFKQYIESQFESWMSWDNYGMYNGTPNYGWDYDHITPMKEGKSEEDVIKLNHYTNLKPLCSYTNRVLKK
jgi:hypothetical protein